LSGFSIWQIGKLLLDSLNQPWRPEDPPGAFGQASGLNPNSEVASPPDRGSPDPQRVEKVKAVQK
jgi:hypothetical protein